MSTGTDVATAEIAGLLAETVERAASLLASGDRLAGPAAAQEDGADLVAGESAVGLGITYPDGTLFAVCLTADLASELCGGTTPDEIRAGMVVVTDEVSRGLGLDPVSTRAFEHGGDLIGFLDGASIILGAGVFAGDDVAATVAAAASTPPAATTDDVPTPPADDDATASDPDPRDGATAPAAPAAPAAHGDRAGDAIAAAASRPSPAVPEDVLARGLALLAEVNLAITAELGRSHLRVSELLALEPGSVIGLEREAGSPVDLLVNGSLFARAEVIVVDDRYAVRITELLTEGIVP